MTDLLDRLKSALGDDYSIEDELGTGGMGTVYRVYDTKRGEHIALKTLHRADDSAIYRFKREFRALADVAHKNLVQLYELVARDDVWFFTMELVDGVSFTQYARPNSVASARDEVTEVDPVDANKRRSGVRSTGSVIRDGVLDEARLRLVLRQLLQGVAALHRAGKIHRDLKPSNVLVTESGQVKILDFGIAAEIASSRQSGADQNGISGTAGYMAPEQCAGEKCGPESDWYAVGVLLFEALTGRLPFSGSFFEVMKQKLEDEAPRPDEFAENLPGDLVKLCTSLLARNPTERPSGSVLLSNLRVSEPAVLIDSHTRRVEGAPLVGRTPHLSALEDALAEVSRGNTVSICVVGPSGIGKTTLVRHFTDSLVRDECAVVLAGRCYAREAVPFKAFDGVMDMLSTLLRGVPEHILEPRLPKDTAALAHVFPVLRRVTAVERVAASALNISDQWELRRRAFTAFRETMADISTERPLVLHIDDLQWVDRDSADVLEDLLRRTKDLRVLFVLSFRSEEVASVPLLKRLIESDGPTRRRVLEIGSLSLTDASTYAEQMLETRRPGSAAYARSLAEESDGNPFLLDQMVRAALEAGGGAESRPTVLGDVLNTRLAQLPAGARALTEVLAVAGQPIDEDVAYDAAELEGDQRSLVTSLRLAHMVRVGATTNRISLYHDKIRETLGRGLSEQRTADIHRRLARCIEQRDFDDPEALYEHYLGAGDQRMAARYAAKAGAGAQEALAFARAALFYQRAIELSPSDFPELGSWYMGLGDAHASAGRGGEAARSYLEAIPRVDERTAIEVDRRVGQQYLISGRIEEGLEVFGRVLSKVGLPQLAPTPKRALLALVLRRMRLAIRGLKFSERPEQEIPSDQLTKTDTCWAVAEGLALVDNIQGAAFQTLHLMLALDTGEPGRIGRALAMEAGFSASSGATAKAARLLDESEKLAHRFGSRSTLGLCRMIGAVSAVHDGRAEDAERFAVEAEGILKEQHGLSGWPLTVARVFHCSALIDEGKIVELCKVSREFLDDALDRGNMFAATMFRSGWSTLRWLSADDLSGAKQALEEALAQCSEGVFYVPHYNCLLAKGMIDLYARDDQKAFEHIEAVWPTLERSLLLRIRSVRVRCLWMRAACAIAAARLPQDNKALLRIAERHARTLERERQMSENAKARLLRAGIAATRGDESTAMEHLSFAIDRFKECRSEFWHALALRRKGQLLGRAEGATLVDEADKWMRGENIFNPAAMTAAFIPGFRFPDAIQETLGIRTPLSMRTTSQ